MAKRRFKRSSKEKIIDESIGLLEISLKADTAKALINIQTLINRMRVQGMSDDVITQTLLDDLESGGRIFGEFNRAVDRAVGGSVQTISRRASEQTFRDEGESDIDETWICALINTCPDCLERHLETKLSSEWDREGRPPSWGSTCDPNCKCILMPANKVKNRKELAEPLKIVRRELRKEGIKVPQDLLDPKTKDERKAVRELGQANA